MNHWLLLLGWLYVMVFTTWYFLMEVEYKPLNLMGLSTGLLLMFGGLQ